jgi:hypothetical protein
MRVRFFPASRHNHKPGEGESPTRPPPHSQIARLLYARSSSQEETYSSTDDDLLDEDAKVKQSLL